MSICRVVIAGILVATLFLQFHSTDALTKEQAAQQLLDRQNALVKMHVGSLNVTKHFVGQIDNVVSIQLSNTCIAIVKSNDTKTCPTYEVLAPVDTTNQKKIGKFIETKGYFHREKPRLVNPSIYFQNNVTFTVCVDCPNDILRSSLQIIITHEPFKWIKRSDNTITNNTRFEYVNRSMEGCQKATIYYSESLLNDTINYLKSNCKDTQFNEKIVITKPYTKHDISTSKAYQYQKWLAEAKKLSAHNCLKSTVC